ncbi:MAG TPA: hypothetical protein PK078_07865 [Anaerolineales bacterium]|nr:hypothetical protein [Anaerolineales bacterium]
MTSEPLQDTETIEDPKAMLEKALIEEFLKQKGYTHDDLKKLPADLVEKLMKEASQYASLKMEEVESRAHLVKELHDDAASLDK